MRKQIKRFLSTVLATTILAGSLVVAPATTKAAASFSMVDGWNETIYAEISGVKDSNVTAVSYSGPTSGSLKGDDLTYLVRDTSNGVRIDIPGLKAGSYTLTVTTTSGTVTKSGIQVAAYDRSGYAHFNASEGVGAYNNDGTLKSNAIVLYVTNANKDSVTVTSKDGTKVTGIGHILNSSGKDVGGGKTAKGGTANKNADIIKKLAADGTPLVVRIIGDVKAPAGVTAYDSVNYGGSVGDNGYMVRMQSGLNVTIEGIGSDATINGWGIHFMAQSSDPNYGKNFEVRNIAFRNVPEDCLGMEGVQEGSSLTAPVERCWIHHCEFYAPKISNPAESDKDGGDGACDFKRGQYFTNSYCYYEGYHKTNLVGASDSNLQYHITYHHNYWKNCESRGPLLRQANVHMYNNVFEGQTSYCMNPRANGYIFSEYNVFKNSKNPMQIKSGAIKSFNDTFEGCKGDQDGTIVSSKSTKVSSSNKYASFELNSSVSYVPANNYTLHTSNVYDKTVALAGVLSAGSKTVDQTQAATTKPQETTAKQEATTASQQQTTQSSGSGSVAGGTSYTHSFADGLSNSFFSITGNTSTSKGSVTYNGTTIKTCLKIESSTKITFDAPAAGKLTLVFGGSTSASGKQIKIDGSAKDIGSDQILTIDLSAGSHTITKDDAIFLYYMSFQTEGSGSSSGGNTQTHTHSYTASVTKAATCSQAGVKTYTCSCGDSYTEAIPATGQHSYTASVTKAATCTTAGVKTYACSCGASYTETIAATGHNYSNEWTIDKQPTTTSEGSKSRHCTACDAKTDVTVIAKLDAPVVTQDGLVYNSATGTYDYYVNGSVNKDYNGLLNVNGTKWYVVDGSVDMNYKGIKTEGSNFWYVENGKIDQTYEGMVSHSDAWWYIKNGKVATDYKGFVDNAGFKWYVAGGKIDITFTGLGYDGTTWWAVRNGKVDTTYCGLISNGGSWWYVTNGILDTSVTGIVETGGSQWLVQTGKLSSSYMGPYVYNGVMYNVVNGKVVQ